jgi:hypothetical protein
MRVHRLRIASFRGTAEREIRFGPGVTVIEGPNEAGKSSLAEALELVFDYLDTSQHKAVRDVFPVDRDASPEIEVEIESGPYAFTYRKRFGRTAGAASTELRIERPRPENATGRAAHERAAAILAETIDVALWRALRIAQGRGVAQANLAKHRALEAALDAASGGEGAADDHQALFDRVEAEYRQYYTPGGKPTGEFAKADGRVAALREEVGSLAERQRALAADVAESERLAERLRRLEEEKPACDAEVERRRAEAARIEELRRALATREAARDRAREAEQAATRTQRERQAQVTRCGEAAQQVADLEPRAKSAAGALDELGLRRDESQRRLAAVRDAEAAAERRLALARQDLDFRRAELESEQFRERLDRVREAQRQAFEAERVLATNGVTREVLAELQQADAALRHARARLVEGGPRVSVRALAPVEVELDGNAVALAAGQEASVSALRPTQVRLPGTLEVLVRPGASIDQLDRAAHEADRAWTEIAARHGVDSFDAATRAHVAREAAAGALRTARERLRDALRDLTPEALEAKWARAREAKDSYRARRPADPPLPDDLAQAKAVLARAQAERDDARAPVAAAEHALEAAREDHDARLAAQARLDGQLEAERTTLAALQDQLEAARRAQPDEALDAALAESIRARVAAEEGVEDVARRLADLQPDQVEAQLASAQAALDALARERQETELARARVAERLDMQREAGLFEALEQARARLAQAERAAAGLARRAAAARVLHDTMVRHRDEATQRYVEPLRARIRDLGRFVFGAGFDVALDADLSITTRTLAGRTLAFDQLTTGTQEQLGFLARLAAAMIVAPHEGVPLVVDDALGHTDPDRIRALNAALGVAGERCQIIVLTCWPERFRGVPGARIERLSAGAAPSA